MSMKVFGTFQSAVKMYMSVLVTWSSGIPISDTCNLSITRIINGVTEKEQRLWDQIGAGSNAESITC